MSVYERHRKEAIATVCGIVLGVMAGVFLMRIPEDRRSDTESRSQTIWIPRTAPLSVR